MLPIITPFLSEVDYGISGTLNSYTAGLSLLGVLSVTTILTPIYYKYPNRYKVIWRQAYGFLILWNVVFAFLLGLVLYFVIPIEAIEYRWLLLFLIVLPIVFFGPTQNIAVLYYTLHQNATAIGLRIAFFGIMAVILNYVFIVIMHKGFMGWYYTSFIIGVATNVSYWLPLNMTFRISPIFNFKIRRIRDILKESLPLLPHQYSIYLLDGSEKVVLNQLKVQTSSIGEITLASTFGNYFGNFINATGSAFMPLFMEHFTNNNINKARNLSIIWQVMILLLCLLFCLWSREIFHVLIRNETLSQTYGLAIFLVMAAAFRPQFSYAYNFLIFNGKSGIIWKYTFFSGVGCVISNFILIPLFNYEVVVYNSFFFFLVWSISLYFSKSFRNINTVKNYLFIRCLTVIIFTILVYEFKDINIYLKLLGTIILALLIVILYISKKDIIVQKVVK